MLSRPGPLPPGQGWSFELKWDGFRAIVSTEDGLHVRSRRDWNMTPLLHGERRALLESLDLEGPGWATNEKFNDGEALYAAVCEPGLEGILAKKLSGRYRPGSRYSIKRKNPSYWRRDSELDAMQKAAERHARRYAVR